MRYFRQKNRRGASAILNIFLFVVLMIFAFWAVNMVSVQRQQSRLQIAADLGSRYGIDLLSRDSNTNRITNKVRSLIIKNLNTGRTKVNKDDLDINISFGNVAYPNGKPVFNKDAIPTNAVSVSVEKTAPFGSLSPESKSGIRIQKSATSAALERDLCIVLDRSGSMRADPLNSNYYPYDPYTSNPLVNNSVYKHYLHYWWYDYPHPVRSLWAETLVATQGLIEELDSTQQDEQLSIVSYGSAGNYSGFKLDGTGFQAFPYNAADTHSVLTKDFDSAYAAVVSDTSSKPLEGATDISAGIDQGRAELLSSSGRIYAFKTMIVLTDGNANRGREPYLAAQDAYAAGIQVHTVTFGSGANQAKMQMAADYGGGKHFHAPDGDKLEEIFRELANLPAAAIVQ